MMFIKMRRMLRKFFTETKHTHCRACGVPIKHGGYGVWALGRGFCVGCVEKILRKP